MPLGMCVMRMARFGLVDVLAAGAGGAERVDLEVGLVDLDLDRVVHDRIDPDAREAGLAPRRGVEGADAHQAVHAGFGLEPAIGGGAGDLQRGGFDAGLLALALLEQLHLVAVLLGPARVHADEHLRPILRLGAAGAGIHLEIGVVAVGLAGQQALDLAALRVLRDAAEGGHAVGDHGRVALGLGHGDQLDRVGELVLEGGEPVDLARQAIALAHHLLRGVAVVPELRILGAGVQLCEASGRDIPVKDASSAARPTA